MSEAPISIGKAYAVAASYYLQESVRADNSPEHRKWLREHAERVSNWARDEYGRIDTFTAIKERGI